MEFEVVSYAQGTPVAVSYERGTPVAVSYERGTPELFLMNGVPLQRGCARCSARPAPEAPDQSGELPRSHETFMRVEDYLGNNLAHKNNYPRKTLQ